MAKDFSKRYLVRAKPAGGDFSEDKEQIPILIGDFLRLQVAGILPL